MAPTQQRARKQASAKPVARKARPAARQTSDSWEVLQRQRSDSRDSDIENEDPTIEEEQPLAIEAAPNHTILTLQEMADRLGREVEDFAESLDKFLDDLRPEDPYEDAFDLVLDFKKQAENRVQELSAKHEGDKNEELRREWAEQAKLSSRNTKSVLASSLQARSITSARVKELRKYQEEADTWQLFSIVLEQHYRPEAVAERERQEKLSKLDAVNKFSHEDDFFVRFLIEDSLGQERNSIKTWLEQTASHQQSSLDDIQHELTKQSKLGNGLWTRGWINTREKIKNEKRLRTWPAPDSSPLPQLRSLDTNELLVTSLDPDATSRQRRSIEVQDAFHEQAIWMTCWEMLRRGLPWIEVVNWCENNQEGWRAVVLGKAMSNASVASAATWRRMCFLASQNECSNEYEAAVYGLLGGNIAAMQPVCKSVDDQLFARYSANLIRQFDQYLLTAHPEQLSRSLTAIEDSDLRDPGIAQTEILELIKKLRHRTETRAQSVSPLKLVQSYLLANETEALIHTMGVAISAGEHADLTIARPRTEQDTAITKPEAEAALDPICLRVVAHISLILQVLRKDQLVVEEQEMEDNVLVSYVQLLHMSGKLDLLPLYASKLQQDRGVASMSAAIAGITDSGERLNIMKLMLQHRVDVEAVTQTIFKAALDQVAKTSRAAPFTILKSTADGVYPGKKIDVENVPDTTSPEQEALIHALEWFLLLPKQWSATMEAFTAAFRTVLVSGNFACARLICETFDSKDVIRLKSSQELGHGMDIFNEDSQDPTTEQPSWMNDMRARAKTYIELERLVEAFEALLSWTKQETVYFKNRAANSTLPSDIRGAFDVVEDAMEPLLSTDGFLLDSFSDEEAADFAKIRQIYVTEAIIAYITALYSAGTHVTRDKLLSALDVSTSIADQRTKLTETFSEAKRMKEVVTMFAQVSKRVLVMKELSKAWKPKDEKHDGRNHKIWDIPSERSVATTS